MRKEAKPRSHAVIPDCQVKPGVSTDHLEYIGRYLAEKRPDVIVCIGDFADMPSLSSYDKGTMSFEGRRYYDDIQSVRKAMKLLLAPIRAARGYKPRLVLTLGNHEDRIRRKIEADSTLHGTISIDDLGYKEDGWEVYPFLTPVVVDGICYCHFFQTGSMGRPVTTASALVKTRHMSATMGHNQKPGLHMGDIRADGLEILGLFTGTCYAHDEGFVGQNNSLRRGIWMKYEVEDGYYDPAFVSLKFLARKYGRKAA